MYLYLLENMNKICVPYLFFVYLFFVYLVHWHARNLFSPACRGNPFGYFSPQTNWHARWDLVLLPSLLRKWSSDSSSPFIQVHNMLHGGL